MKEALQWYTTTSDAIYQKREKELDVIQRYIPDDTEVKDAITEANNYSGFLIKYKNLLNRKYEIYKGKIGTKKFNLVKYIRGQDNEYKPLDESFFEREPRPLPMRELKLPIVGGAKIRRKGGAFETLIASKKDIDVEIDFYRKVRAHVETYMEKLNSLLRRKRAYIQEEGIQDPGEEETVPLSSTMRGTPGVEVPTFPSSRPDVISPEGVFRQPDEPTTADFSGFTAPITGTQQFAFTNPGIANKAAFAKTQRRSTPGPGTTRKNARITDADISAAVRAELKEAKAQSPAVEATKQAEIAAYEAAERNPQSPFSLQGGPAAGTGLLPPPPAQPTDLSSIPIFQPPSSVTPGSLPPSRIPGFGTAIRKSPLELGGPLPRGGMRKKKLRSRRGGKQKKTVRRTRRS
jgi:hypothetical protein